MTQTFLGGNGLFLYQAADYGGPPTYMHSSCSERELFLVGTFLSCTKMLTETHALTVTG